MPHRGHVFAALIQPVSYLGRLNFAELFPRPAPLEVDLGCGDGSFICALARRSPEKNFLAIERLHRRVQSTARKAATSPNLRVLRVESAYAVRYLLPPDSTATFYLLFPDPWPKRRHQRRRLVNSQFLSATGAALVQGGIVHFATDQFDYFKQIKGLATSSANFDIVPGPEEELPVSKFEARFRAAGAPIYRLSLRKISPVT